MRRGEVWRYVSKGFGRELLVIVVSSQGINDAPETDVVLGIEITDDDPGHLLAVQVLDLGWASPLDLRKFYKRSFSGLVAPADAEIIDRLDSRIRVTFDL